MTARLGQAGLIERMPDELDGRGARLHVTPEGRRTLRLERKLEDGGE